MYPIRNSAILCSVSANGQQLSPIPSDIFLFSYCSCVFPPICRYVQIHHMSI